MDAVDVIAIVIALLYIGVGVNAAATSLRRIANAVDGVVTGAKR